MKRTWIFWTAISLIGTIFLFPQAYAQDNLEVEGKAKIAVMDKNNSADSVVVRLSDGTLAVRDVSTISSQSYSTGNYGTVVNPITGKVWLDRNLGATQVATSSNDTASYGDLYQWGRGADGHQLRNSSTTETLATNWLSGSGGIWDGDFIISPPDPFNWLTTEETHMWSGTAAENNPCPSGFRVPTNAEWQQEMLTWISDDAAGALASPLKLPAAGYRSRGSGSVSSVGTYGGYWSSTVQGSSSRYLEFDNGASVSNDRRATGLSVRCILD